LKGFEQEHARLKRLVADLSLDNSILKEVAAGNFSARPDGGRQFSMPWLPWPCRNAEPVVWWDNAGPRSSMYLADQMMRRRCEQGLSPLLVPMGGTGTGGSRPCFNKKGGASTTNVWSDCGARRA